MYKRQNIVEIYKIGSLCGILFCINILCLGQNATSLSGQDSKYNIIQTAVPFLTIAPDSRSGALGDAGAATSPDVNSQHWNPAKYVFSDNQAGFSFTYTPWLSNLVSGINLLYVVGYYKINPQSALSASLRYFSLGQIDFINEQGKYMSTQNPNEYAVDAAYSRKFSDKVSGAIAFRYIRSAIAQGASVDGTEAKAGWSVASDVSVYYNTDITLGGKDSKLAFGTDISNMGRKMSYTDNQDAEFIPINLRLGGALTTNVDDYNSFCLVADINKLLVPTTPYYSDSIDPNTNKPMIDKGKNPDVSVPVGMIQSFYDAPDGLKEEMQEIMYSLGLEYWYRKQFAIRAGYFNEAKNKGNRKYFTTGVGLKLNVLSLDFSYLIPVYMNNNPLARTLRFSISFNFDSGKNKRKVKS